MRKAILLLAILCTACSNYPAYLPSIKPYRMDIQQGNVITPKMMMQLRPGMSKAQVKFIMGTPLISDSFHANRWDYYYRMQKDGRVIEERRVILDFEDDKLAHVRGDVIPAASGDSATPEAAPNKAPVTLKSVNDPAPRKEKGWLDKLKFWKSDDVPAPAAPKVEAVPAAGAVPALPSIPAQPERELPPLMTEPAAEAASAVPPKAPDAPPPQTKAPPAKAAPDAPKMPQAAPRPEPKAEAAPKPATSSEPKPVRKQESKPVPRPSEDLPSEEDPSYFDRMLEKIGF